MEFSELGEAGEAIGVGVFEFLALALEAARAELAEAGLSGLQGAVLYESVEFGFGCGGHV